eukprot:287983-Pelagomonas_calceolata.AAC.1
MRSSFAQPRLTLFALSIAAPLSSSSRTTSSAATDTPICTMYDGQDYGHPVEQKLIGTGAPSCSHLSRETLLKTQRCRYSHMEQENTGRAQLIAGSSP